MVITMASLRTGRPRIRVLFSGRVTSSFSKASTRAMEPTQPPIQSVTGALSPAKKRLRREADQSSPFSVEVNTLRTGLLNCLNARSRCLTFRHRAYCM